MKTKFFCLFLLLTFSAFSQQVKWSYTFPEPQSYERDQTTAFLMGNDEKGGVVLILLDSLNGASIGQRIVWLSRLGTLNYITEFQSTQSSVAAPIFVSKNVILFITPYSGSTPQTIRRVAIKGGTAIVNDFTPGTGQVIAHRSSSLVTADALGIFTFRKSGDSMVEIVRYTP